MGLHRIATRLKYVFSTQFKDERDCRPDYIRKCTLTSS